MTLEHIHLAGNKTPKIVAKVLQGGGKMLLEKQKRILQSTYVRQSGVLESFLDPSSLTIQEDSENASMTITYPMYMRYLDLKRTKHGKKKKRYQPIYNKYVWGFLMGYTYNNIRVEMANSIETSIDSIHASINIIGITK